MKVYISCGAGDFIAIESFLTLEEKNEISSFVLFTRAADTIKQLIDLHPIWRGLPVEIPMTPEEIRSFGVYSFFHIPHLKRTTKQEWPQLKNCIDFSGEVLYPQILSGNRQYTESLFETQTIKCDVVIDKESHSDDRMVRKGRNLTKKEVASVLAETDGLDIRYTGIGRTILEEALALVKGCKFFYGVDSMLACWAARQPEKKLIKVKTINRIYVKWLKIYDPFNRITVMQNGEW